jgi:coatomer subunit beta'
VRTGQWVGDCFIYTTSTNRLNYLVGDQVNTVSHFDQPMYVMGYLPRDGRVYLADRDVGITSYALSLAVVEYQTLVLRGDLDAANQMLPDINEDQKNKIARFLEGQGYKEQALEVATDPEHRFDLALSLDQLQIALELARTADVEHKWKTVGDAALSTWDMALAEECFTHAKDLGSLLLLYSSTGNVDGLRSLYSSADAAGANNIAFSCLWQIGDTAGCVDLLQSTGRVAEAVLFAQTYCPSKAPAVASRWRNDLEEKGKGRLARTLGMPPGVDEGIEADEDLFPEWEQYLQLEQEGGKEEENLIDVGDDDAETQELEAKLDGTNGTIEDAPPLTQPPQDTPAAPEEEEAEVDDVVDEA